MTKKEVLVDTGIALILVSLILLTVDLYERFQESTKTDFASVSIISHAVVPTSTLLPAYTVVPSISIIGVNTDQSVTILTNNFPNDRVFYITMGPMGSRGINGILVGTLDSGPGGAFHATFPIPEALKGSYQIAIRMQSIDSFYAYNWFYNNTGGTGGPLPPIVQSPTSYSSLTPAIIHTPSPIATHTTVPTMDVSLWNVLTPPPTPNITPFSTSEIALIEVDSLPGWEIQVEYPSKIRSGGQGAITLLLSEKSAAFAGRGARRPNFNENSTEYQGLNSTPFPIGTPESQIVDAYGRDSLICVKPHIRGGGAFTVTNLSSHNDLCSEFGQKVNGRVISWMWEIMPKENSNGKHFIVIFLDGEWKVGDDAEVREIRSFWEDDIWVDVYIPTFQVSPLNPLDVIVTFFTLGLTFLLTAIAGPYINQRMKKGKDV